MTIPPSTPVAGGRSPLPFVLGGCAALALGCAALALCALLAGVAGAGYRFYTQRITGAMQEPEADLIRAGLESLPEGNASGGERVFRGAGGCSACHSLGPDVRMISGPSLSGVASRAATVRPGYSGEMYIYESIVYPNAYVVEGFQGGIMPTGFKNQLSEQQLADLVAFLMTK